MTDILKNQGKNDKEYLSKKYQRARLNFKDLRSKAVVRLANLAKRMDLGHQKPQKKK